MERRSDGMRSVLISVPTYENIHPKTFKSIYDLEGGGCDLSFSYVRGYTVADARNKIARDAKAGGFDYVLMVDSDVVLPHDALRNMLELDVGVCLGYYVHRHDGDTYDGTTNLCRLGETSYTDQYKADELRGLEADGYFKLQIHGGGLGCALIRTDVFGALHYPHFKWTNYKNGNVLSEDLWFCECCKNASVPIYADTRVGCGHVVSHVEFC